MNQIAFSQNAKNYDLVIYGGTSAGVSAGIWNINDGREQPFAAFLRNLWLDYNQNLPSLINGKLIGPLPETSKWWQGKTVPWGNVAGEHHYYVEGWNELKY